MAKIKDLDGRVENREREGKTEEKGKEGVVVVVEGEKQRERNEITGGDVERERKEEQKTKLTETTRKGRNKEKMKV